MLPEADFRRLSLLQRQLAEALVNEDWPSMGELNTSITQSLERLSADGKLTQDTMRRLAPLKNLHAEVLRACATECDRLRAILQRHTEFGEGRQAYSLVDTVQGVD